VFKVQKFLQDSGQFAFDPSISFSSPPQSQDCISCIGVASPTNYRKESERVPARDFPGCCHYGMWYSTTGGVIIQSNQKKITQENYKVLCQDPKTQKIDALNKQSW